MNRYLSAPLAIALILTGPAAAELQPRKAPASPNAPPVPATPAAPVAPKAAPGGAAPVGPGKPATPAVPAAAKPTVGAAEDPKLSPDLSAKLLKQLDDVEKGLGGKRGGESLAMIKMLKEAATGKERSFNLWLDCKKEVDFEQKGKTATEFSEWRRKEAKTLEVKDDFCASLQLQVQFLALALLDSHADTPEQRLSVMAEANLYLDAVAKTCDRQDSIAKSILSSIMDVELDPDRPVTVGDLADTLKQVREAAAAVGGDIMESIFAKKLKPESCTGNHPPTATHPGNIDEIYEQLVMKTLREKKDAAGLAAAWTRRITQTAAIAKSTKVKELADRFETEKLPVLKWLQARDQWRCGQTEAAATTMIALIRANPGHKECPHWITELRGLATVQ